MQMLNCAGRLAVATRHGIVDVGAASGGRFGPDPQSAFDDWPAFCAWTASLPLDSAPVDLLDTAVLGPPVPRPAQVFAIGLNYREHAREAGLAIPDAPPTFTKFPSCLTGPHAPVALPAGAVDWEVELVVVIGIRAEHVSPKSAWAHVAGVMVGQDLSERVLQTAGPVPQFSLGKSFPGFGPTGPALVTLNELSDPDDLELGCQLEDGEILQKSRTSDMVFPVPQLIARLSAVCPLLPGDLIFTGTPSGVGASRNPRQFLQPGDVLMSWVQDVGQLRNPITVATTIADAVINS
jgi:2,4-diketo-3-deoxy-L-fuconate hydrolase